MRSIGLFGALVLSFALMPPAMAQNEYRQSYTAEKEHGTFIAYLKADPDLQGKSGGFISDVEVGLKWTGFFGQPVESYTLKWEAGDAYRFYHQDRNETVSLRRRDLSAYPDLQAEYDAIKPTDIVLDFQVRAHALDGQAPPTPNAFLEYGAVNSVGSFRTGAGNFNNANAYGSREIRRTPHLVIARSGCRSSDIVPSSPRSHREFVQWSVHSGNDYEQSAKNTLNSATRIVFSDLEIRSVELPEYKFKNIYDELQRRKTVPDDPVAAARKAEADAFWGDQRPDASGKRVVSVEQAAPCKEPPRFVAEEKHQIKYDEDSYTYSVVAPDGRVLITPTQKHLVSYQNGVAFAFSKLPDDQPTSIDYGKTIICCPGWNGCDFPMKLEPWVEGKIDKSGEWISPPDFFAEIQRVECSSTARSRLESYTRSLGAKLVEEGTFESRVNARTNTGVQK